MPITNPDQLKPGDVLVRRYKGQEYRCFVDLIGNGLGFRLEDGREFRTPSTAGKAIIGTECSGYVWWHRADDPPAKRGPKPGSHRMPKTIQPIQPHTRTIRGISPVRSALPAKAVATVEVPPERRVRQTKNIKLCAYQSGLKAGQFRLWCGVCSTNFISTQREPDACPHGHPALLPPGVTTRTAPKASLRS